MTEGIKDKVVVITGASSGLGEATAKHLAARSAKLILRARRLDRLQALAGELSLGADAVLADRRDFAGGSEGARGARRADARTH